MTKKELDKMWMDYIKVLENDNSLLKKAVEVYASEINWANYSTGFSHPDTSMYDKTPWLLAQQTLKDVKI